MVNDIHTKTLRCFGEPFNYIHSSCSDLEPSNFRWSKDRGDCDIYIDNAMMNGIVDVSIAKEKRFGWVCESKFIVPSLIDYLLQNYVELFKSHFNKIFTCEKELLDLDSNFVFNYAGSNYPWIKKELWTVYGKSKTCSMFCSPKTYSQGHIYRQEIAKIASGLGVDVYGPYFKNTNYSLKNIDTKIDGLRDYMFHIVIENGVTENYFTEKIVDCFSTGTIPVYLGAKKVLDIFDPRGIILLEKGQEEQIISKLTPELYISMLPHVYTNLEILKTIKLADDYLFDSIKNIL